MKKCDKKLQKGITLIALVITIIVLLILAGITISTLTGENGILKRATNAKEETKKMQYKEMIELLIMEQQIEASKELSITKPFIQIIKEEIEKRQWQWLENVYICNDDLDEVLNPIDGTHIIVDTKDGYEIILQIDNALKIGKIIHIEKINKPKWTVKFDLNGGDGETPKNKEVRQGWSIKLPTGEKINKTDYKFIGWSTTRDGEVLQSKFIPQKDNTTLYARWSQDTVTVTLKGNGTEQEDIIQNVIRGHEFILNCPFERNGYEFIGWGTRKY